MAVYVWISALSIFLAYVIFSIISKSFSNPKRIQIEIPVEAKDGWTADIVRSHSVSEVPGQIHCFDPATGYSLGSQKVVFPLEVTEIVKRARIAQKSWAKTCFKDREALLSTLLQWIIDHQADILAVCSRDSGKTAIDGSFGEILTTCEKLRWTIANGKRVLSPEYRKPGLIMALKYPVVEYVPFGVMGCIVSWNYPFHNVIGPVISSLMAGNACVVKCSEHVAWSTLYWQSIFTAALKAHGIDENLVVLMNGFAETGQALVETADKITFIGSPGVGKRIMQHAAQTLTPVVLELGGKDCAIVFDDCDYPQFRDCALRLCFQNAGQNCAGMERVIIQHGSHDKFVADMLKVVSKFRVGAPCSEDVDMGAITMFAQLEIIQTLVDDAVAKGANLVTGGKSFKHPKYPMGHYYLPTIITGITAEMRIAREEVFGPVMLIFAFKNEFDAIKIANSSGFGLGSGVFSLDLPKATRVCAQIRAGMTNVNAFGTTYLCQGLPFGGVGTSGVDCFSGEEGLKGQCFPKATTRDRFAFLGIRTTLPAPLHYPLTQESTLFQSNVMQILYSASFASKLKGIMNLVKIATKKKNE